MSQRDVAPQAQSLCFTEHARQLQYSHQIHLRWFTSSRKRATIQRRISVCDTLSNVSTPPSPEQWAGRPNLPGCRSYEYGAKRSSEEPLRPDASSLERAAAAADAARKHADQPDQRDDRGCNEEPMNDEPTGHEGQREYE
jgi:hypothetical protein